MTKERAHAHDTHTVLHQLARHFGAQGDSSFYPVFFAAYDYYFVPRGESAREIARKNVQFACERYNETGELPEWFIRVHETVIEGDEPSLEKSVPPPQHAY